MTREKNGGVYFGLGIQEDPPEEFHYSSNTQTHTHTDFDPDKRNHTNTTNRLEPENLNSVPEAP